MFEHRPRRRYRQPMPTDHPSDATSPAAGAVTELPDGPPDASGLTARQLKVLGTIKE